MKKLIFPTLLTLLALPLLFQVAPIQILKLKTFDYLVPKQEPTGFFTILNISEENVIAEGGYPFPRQRLAEIQKQLVEKGALGVGWVIAFTEKDRFGGDTNFAISLRMLPSVLAMFDNESQDYPPTTGTVILGDKISGIKAGGVRQNIPILRVNANQGVSTAPTEVDNLVRQIPLLMQTPDGWVASFGTEVLKALAQQKTYIIKGSEAGIEEISVRGIPPTKLDKFGRQWISWVDTPQTTLQEMDVAGKFVFVGVTAKGVMPQIATPVGLLEPHKIQAALSESILLENSSYIPNWSLAAELAVLMFLGSLTWLVLNALGITGGLVLTSLLHLLVAFGGWYSIQTGILLDVSWSLVSGFIIASTAFYMRFREQYKLRQQIKKQFEHYLDPRQVKRLQDNPELLKLGGEGGMVDKFIGDAGMYIFNAPLDMLHHPKIAVECAIDIIKNVGEVNLELVAEGLPSVAIGCGVNTGEAIIGNMGSSQRFDYTAIGDAVNIAARLESATKERAVNILIGEETEKFCGYQLKELKSIEVKGKSKPLIIYTWDNNEI
jgi:adenylate cyclase